MWYRFSIGQKGRQVDLTALEPLHHAIVELAVDQKDELTVGRRPVQEPCSPATTRHGLAIESRQPKDAGVPVGQVCPNVAPQAVVARLTGSGHHAPPNNADRRNVLILGRHGFADRASIEEAS
jgi:hypothetical protein